MRRRYRKSAVAIVTTVVTFAATFVVGIESASAAVLPSECPGVVGDYNLVTTGSNSQTLNGTAGKDLIITANGTNTVNGNGGDDCVVGGTGIDTVTTLGGNDVILTGNGADVVNAGDGANHVITAGDGDNITTGTGSDVIDAGDGANTIVAGPGANDVTSGGSADNITTGDDNDIISAGSGANVIDAGQGVNNVTATSGADHITTGDDNDTINGGSGANVIDAGQGKNTVTTSSDGDTITTGDGDDTINGGSGANVIDAGNGKNSVTTGGDADNIVTGDGDDTIVGGSGANNPIDAGAGADNISTGGGSDTVYGGPGNDTIDTAGGTDVVRGNAGNDVITYTASASDDVQGNSGCDTINGVLEVGDVCDPQVTIDEGPSQTDPTSVDPIVFDVVFNEPVNGFTDADLDITSSTTGGGTTASITGSSIDGSTGAETYTVEVTGMSVDGDVILSFVAGAATNAGNSASAAPVVIDNQVTFDAPVTDTDGDGIPDSSDNCPSDANADQADTDGDGLGDACDPFPNDPDNDVDGDGVSGDVDNCPSTANSGQEDADADGIGDACDPDDDNDGVVDGSDLCPSTPSGDTVNTDGCTDTDADGVADTADNCPTDANADQADADSDGLGDACDQFPNDPDNDVDGDGVGGDVDNCPSVSNPDQADTDGDNIGDACDSQDNSDPDSDGVQTFEDNCPTDANADQADLDGDGQGDVCDPDDDGDGVADTVDNCPVDANADQADGDGDNIGTACDADESTPVVTINSISPDPVDPGTTTTDVKWQADEGGAYTVRVGGTDCVTGTQLASGTYATVDGEKTTTVNATSLAYGSNTIRVCVTDGASPAHTGFDTEGVVRRVPTTLTYTGDTGRVGTGNVTMKGTLADSQSACDVRGQNISFYIDLNGDAAFTSGELIQTKATSGGTNDSSEAVANPYSLTPGIWLVKLVFSGSTNCAPTSDADGIISVVNPDDAANGGGWYQIGSVTGASKTVNFGFTTRYDTKAAGYRGQILVHNKQAWRLKGDITAFAKKSSNPGTGEVTGTAALFCWDIPTGTWKLADGSVTFKAAFTDTGDNKKTGSTKPDSFTVSSIGGYAPQNACPATVTPLVQGTQQALKGGNIYIK